METKICSKCKTEKLLSEYYKDKRNPDGHVGRCKVCCRQYRKDIYPESKGRIAKATKKWRDKNLEKARETSRNWVKNNPERHAENSRIWRENNIEREREVSRKWRVRNCERHAENGRMWKKNNPEKVRAYSHKRRDSVKSAEGNFTAEELRERLEEQGFMCFYCHYPLGDDFHADHYIPLSRGGTNYIDNIVCACPTCNLKKGNKMPEEFMTPLPLFNDSSVSG